MKKLLFGFSLILLIILTYSCSRSFHIWNAKRTGDIKENYKAQDADNRMYNLQWFEQQYQAIQSYKTQYEADPDEDRRLGVKMILNREIGKYNAAMRTYYRAEWANEDLPKSIELIK